MTGQLLRAFRALLVLLPRPFRDGYADEMVGVLADQLRDRPRAEQMRIFAAAVTDLGLTVPREHLAAAAAPARPAVAAGPSPGDAPPPARAPKPRPSRRQFLRGAIAVTAGASGLGVVSSSVAYLWPDSGQGFGSLVTVGSLAQVRADVDAAGGTLAVPEARSYLVTYDPADDPDGRYRQIAGGSGLMALYQKCVHLGCRVPWCGSSLWFECPCHGSKYNRWGEFEATPAPRGLDRFQILVQDDVLIIDSRVVVPGPPRSVNTLDEKPAGSFCR